MRFSNYNILSEKLDTDAYVILNGLTGAMDIISASLRNFIVLTGGSSFDEELLERFEVSGSDMLKRGYATMLSSEEECAYAGVMAKNIDLENRNSLSEPEYELMLIPDYNCNYRCTYCFERDNEYMKKCRAAVLSIEQADAFFEFAKEHPAQKAITLYGGEPLNKNNREMVDYIVNKGKSLGFDFFVITNGHDLDSFIPYIGGDSIRFLQITIDGPKRIHDKRRISLDRESSFEHILENIKKILDIENIEILLRVNIDKTNVGAFEELIEELVREKIYPNDKVKLVGGLVTGAGDISISYDEVNASLEDTYKKYPNIKNFMDLPSFITEQIDMSLTFGIPFYRRISACPVPEKMLIFAPDWNIYSCSDYVGRPEFSIGTYDEKGTVSWNEENRSVWMMAKVFNNMNCMKCRYAFICAGGCHKYIYKGIPHEQGRCDYYKKYFPKLLRDSVNAFINKRNN